MADKGDGNRVLLKIRWSVKDSMKRGYVSRHEYKAVM